MTLNPADECFVNSLRAVLPAVVFREVTPNYLEEPRGRWAGQAGCVLAPSSAQEVSTILAACNSARVGVVPYGGGTSLVGGQVMENGALPVVLSMERMNKIRQVDASENVMVAEAGVILENVHGAAEAEGRLFPLSIAAKGTAQIGGNLATNAGGVNVLRYGNARDLCLGVEAVLADGQIIHGLTRLRKDNTGYDIRNLLIGAEGSLGVITAAALKLVAPPAASGTALMVVPSPEAALELFSRARAAVGEGISAFELVSGVGLEFLAEKLPDVRRSYDPAPDWMVLMEFGLARGLSPQAALEALFAEGLAAAIVSDGIIAQSESQRQELWDMREHIPEANRLIGAVVSNDISLPLSEVVGFVRDASEEISKIGDFRINCFGHLGDGNLHYNIFPPKGAGAAGYSLKASKIKELVNDMLQARGGSFSAEHGVGRVKVGDLEHYGDAGRLAAMRAIKTALDPHGIMNPGVILRD